MKHARTFFSAAMLAVVLAACGPAAPSLTAEEAHAVLEDFARGHAPADVCTPEGRSLLRSAVRTYGKAQEDLGVEWPDVVGIMTDEQGTIAEIDALAIGALAGGFIEPSDLRGPAQTLSRIIGAVHHPAIADVQRAVRHACSEVFARQQAVARAAIEEKRYQQAVNSAERFGEHRVRDVRRRYAPRLARIGREVERLTAAVERKLESVPAD
jgi:hypothetical protein